MTDVKKTDVWVKEILLMTCLQQLETTCQINSNSFYCRPAQGNGSSALENRGEKDLPYHMQTNHFINMKANIYRVKVLIFIIFRVQGAVVHVKLYQSNALDHGILLFSNSHALLLCFKFPSE